jgi:hypothetical protein
MQLTSTDRIIAGLAAAYFAYRLWSGWGAGIIYGDGDPDVHADKNLTAFVLTALTTVLIIALLACIAIGSDAAHLTALTRWIWMF